MVSREGYLLDRVTEPEGFLSSAIQQYYADGQRYVPRELLVPVEIPDRGLLEEWLSGRRGNQVRIRVPQRGEKVRLLELVLRNARLAFDLEWRHRLAAGSGRRGTRRRTRRMLTGGCGQDPCGGENSHRARTSGRGAP